jgi:hypothetical protein
MVRAALGASAIALLASASPAFAGNIQRFDASYAEPAPPVGAARPCWRWSTGAKDWTWACRLSAYKRAYPADPLQPPAPVRADYPDPGAAVAGSSLGFALQAAGRESGFQSHAD